MKNYKIEAFENLVDAFGSLPAIGKKTAIRLAYHAVMEDGFSAMKLAHALETGVNAIQKCSKCHNMSEDELCTICASPSRDSSCICVVEKPVDVFAIERGGRFRGLYHILGGVLSPLSGITVDKLRIAELGKRIREEKPAEIIVGLGGSADAETTSLYLARFFKNEPVKFTRFARGLPAGMELEYVDQLTLSQALHERTDMNYGN